MNKHRPEQFVLYISVPTYTVYVMFALFYLLQMTMRDVASESMINRIFQGMHSVDPGVALPPGGGVSREQLVIFLADICRGTAEERAPLVLAMAGGETAASATADQIRGVSTKEFTYHIVCLNMD